MRDRHKANTNNNHLTLEGFQHKLHLSLEGAKHNLNLSLKGANHNFHNHLTIEGYQHNHLSPEGYHKSRRVYNLVVSLNHKPIFSQK